MSPMGYFSMQALIILLYSSPLLGFVYPRQRLYHNQQREKSPLFSPTRKIYPLQGGIAPITSTRLWESINQSKDALRSLIDFHDGTWEGTATSFSVSNDVSAGVRLRKVSPGYKTTVKVGLDLQNQDYVLTETMEWEDKVKCRKLSLVDSNADVDAVDGSYSLDMSLPDMPSDIIGTNKLMQFGVEHCIAVNDDARTRAFVFYSIDQSLGRVVVCHEKRVAEAVNSLVLGTDGGETAERQEARPEFLKANEKLQPVHINLLDLSSGVWLGDMILREPTSYQEPKGFSNTSKRNPPKKKFASWSLGVQKLAHEFKWDLDDKVQKIVTVGKPIGNVGLPKEMAVPISGIVGVDESLSTSLPKGQRMIYLDWMRGEQVSIFVGNVVLQLPRYLSFEQSGGQNRRPFFTEMAVYQAEVGTEDATERPELVCSASARAYSPDGQLKQASTGFFEFKRAINQYS